MGLKNGMENSQDKYITMLIKANITFNYIIF
jgi:hypothetical protein